MRRTLVIGPVYRPRANKQFDIAFCVFWTLPGPLRHSYSLILSPDGCVKNFMFESLLMRMPGPRDIVIYMTYPAGIFYCAKDLGLGTHFNAKAPGCPGGWQIDTCINPQMVKPF